MSARKAENTYIYWISDAISLLCTSHPFFVQIATIYRTKTSWKETSGILRTAHWPEATGTPLVMVARFILSQRTKPRPKRWRRRCVTHRRDRRCTFVIVVAPLYLVLALLAPLTSLRKSGTGPLVDQKKAGGERGVFKLWPYFTALWTIDRTSHVRSSTAVSAPVVNRCEA